MKTFFWTIAMAMMASFAYSNDTKVIEITGNDMMQFNIKSFEVKAGEKVKVVLKHVGKLEVKLMGHNIVILNKDVDINKFGMGIMSNGATPDNGYIPVKAKDQIFKHTDMIGGGQETSIEFTAPKAGEYPFLCTFPGHFAIMQGKMIVK